MKTKLLTLILIAGLISACASQPTQAPASQPTKASAPATEAPAATDTSAPAQPTEAPATQPAPQAATISFTNDILPLLESRCVTCHGGERVEEGLNMKSYANLMAGSDNGLVITAGDASNSLLVDLVTKQKMPKRGPKLTPPQIQLITDWVNQGALNN